MAYSVYALLRGEMISSYPYYSIDVGTLGWPRVLARLGGLLVVFVLVGSAVRAIAHWRRPRTLPLLQ